MQRLPYKSGKVASEYRVLAGLTVDVTGEGTGYKFPLQTLKNKRIIFFAFTNSKCVS